ncbi:MAG: CysS/YqeB C-terminal domain-containing protein, partial [Woeseiaceae bacterium]
DEEERRVLALAIYAAGDLLGLMATDADEWFAGSPDRGGATEDEIADLIEQRNKARADRDFATADAIRDRLAAAGISIEDGASGTRWRRTT